MYIELQNFYNVWSWKSIIIINYTYRFCFSPHDINHMWRTWHTSTASVLETEHPGFCIREETSSTTLAFLMVTLTMTLKVKTHTPHFIGTLAFIIPKRLALPLPFTHRATVFCFSSHYLHRDQKQHVWGGHQTLSCYRPSPAKLPERRFYGTPWSWFGAVRIFTSWQGRSFYSRVWSVIQKFYFNILILDNVWVFITSLAAYF